MPSGIGTIKLLHNLSLRQIYAGSTTFINRRSRGSTQDLADRRSTEDLLIEGSKDLERDLEDLQKIKRIYRRSTGDLDLKIHRRSGEDRGRILSGARIFVLLYFLLTALTVKRATTVDSDRFSPGTGCCEDTRPCSLSLLAFFSDGNRLE